MEKVYKYIKSQFYQHMRFVDSIKEVESGFCTQFLNPKNGKRITFSEKSTLIDKDLDKRVKNITSKIKQNNI